MLDNIRDYLDEFSYLHDPDKRNKVIFVIIFIIALFIPLHYAHKWQKMTDYNYNSIAENKAQIKKLKNYANSRVKEAKIRLKNQAQTQKAIEKNTNDFVDAQSVLMDYKKKNTKVTSDEYNKAKDITKKLITSTDLLNDPENYLITYPSYTDGLKISVSYAPSYSVYTKTIPIVFHYNLGNTPIYVVEADYDLTSNQFTDFDVYQTQYTYRYTNKLSLTEKKKYAKQYNTKSMKHLDKNKKNTRKDLDKKKKNKTRKSKATKKHANKSKKKAGKK